MSLRSMQVYSILHGPSRASGAQCPSNSPSLASLQRPRDPQCPLILEVRHAM